jgi:hypothetical protein
VRHADEGWPATQVNLGNSCHIFLIEIAKLVSGMQEHIGSKGVLCLLFALITSCFSADRP